MTMLQIYMFNKSFWYIDMTIIHLMPPFLELFGGNNGQLTSNHIKLPNAMTQCPWAMCFFGMLF